MVKDFLSLIYAKLSEVGETYYGHAPEEATYPFLTFQAPSQRESNFREDFIVEVDLWSEDATQVEELASLVDARLNRLSFTDGLMQVRAFRDTTLRVPDPNPNLHRVLIRYLCKVYFAQ